MAKAWLEESGGKVRLIANAYTSSIETGPTTRSGDRIRHDEDGIDSDHSVGHKSVRAHVIVRSVHQAEHV